MQHPLSDEDTTDSESGIRFKTANTRNKFSDSSSSTRVEKSRSPSPWNSYTSSKSRSRNRPSGDRSRSRSRTDPRSRRSRSRSVEYRHQHKKKHRSHRTPEKSYSRHSSEYRKRKHDECRTSSHGHSSRSDRKSEKYVSGPIYKKSDSDETSKTKCASGKTSDATTSSKFDRDTRTNLKGHRNDSSEDLENFDGDNISDENSSESNDDVILSPVLPPYLAKVKTDGSYIHSEVPTAEKHSVDVDGKFSRKNVTNFGREKLSEKNLEESETKNKEAILGPVLPPHLLKQNNAGVSASGAPTVETNLVDLETKKVCKKHEEQTQKISEEVILGPVLPPRLVKEKNYAAGLPTSDDDKQNATETEKEFVGPVLPPHLLKQKDDSGRIDSEMSTADFCENNDNSRRKISEEEKSEEIIGPVLPAHLAKQNVAAAGPGVPTAEKKSPDSDKDCPKIIGPIIPAHLRTALSELSEDIQLENIPSEEEEQEISSDSDEDFIGPVPVGQISANPSHLALEERALELKINSLNPNSEVPTVREEWMLELPEVHSANLGLGPRKFRANGVPDLSDRSSWTDTPEDKIKKEPGKKSEKIDLKKEDELRRMKERNLEQETLVEKHKKKKKRDKSLLDMHQEELQKKQKKEGATATERRPFSRDIDLKVNRFDEAQKKAILKKAQLLDDRFSSGQSKFL